MTEGIWPAVLGRFVWHALPFVRAWENPTASEIIGAVAGSIVIIGAVFVVALITRLGAWRYLWSEWLTSLDHKKIGIMYIVLAFVMLARALIEARADADAAGGGDQQSRASSRPIISRNCSARTAAS